MIDISKLTEKDVGMWVKYTKGVLDEEFGKLKSWNDKFIFVVYKCDGRWSDFKNYTAAATNPEDLDFCVPDPPTKDEILYEGRDYDSSVKEVNEGEDE